MKNVVLLVSSSSPGLVSGCGARNRNLSGADRAEQLSRALFASLIAIEEEEEEEEEEGSGRGRRRGRDAGKKGTQNIVGSRIVPLPHEDN